MPEDDMVLSDEKKLELWRAFHAPNTLGPQAQARIEERLKLLKVKTLYDNDDIFRREIDGLKEKMQKKKMKLKVVDKIVDEYMEEAEYRKYIATFEEMKQNFDARKKEMAKIKNAFS